MRRHFLSYIAIFMATCAFALQAIAAPAKPIPKTFRPVLIFDSASEKGDKSFTEAALVGAERARAELGLETVSLPIRLKDNREGIIKKAVQGGATHVIAVGFENVLPVLKLAEENPGVKFTVIDGIVPPLYANVQSVIFKDHEGAFLIGMIAAYTSRTGTIGFIGGMDVPLIRNFSLGFLQGAKYARPDIDVLSNMVGTTRDAWSSPAKAGVIAGEQFEKGADVVFAAAGGSGLGVLAAAKERGRLAIGVDSNQNGLYPGFVLTSMVKRVDLAVFDALKAARDSTWQPGIKYLGVKDSMLDFTVDRYNKSLISKETIEKVEAAKELIIRGLVTVQVYTPN